MIESVVWEFNWEPGVISGLFLDSVDHEGLEWWYDKVVAMHKRTKPK